MTSEAQAPVGAEGEGVGGTGRCISSLQEKGGHGAVGAWV
jgi:hypothetical protein